MTWMRIAVVAFVVAAGLLVWHGWTQLPELPDRVASHFDAAGRPDGWSDREDYARFTWLMNGLMIVLFAGLAAAFSHLPASLVNIPHREYWFAPARADATRAELAAWLLAYGAWLLLFLLFVEDRVVRFNQGLDPSTGGIWIGLAVFLAGTALWTGLLLRRFARPPRRSGS